MSPFLSASNLPLAREIASARRNGLIAIRDQRRQINQPLYVYCIAGLSDNCACPRMANEQNVTILAFQHTLGCSNIILQGGQGF
jgi:hypothetical protein